MDALNTARQAVLRYGDATFEIVRDGDYVVCAVTSRRIPLAALRYWSVDLQEAYVDAATATARWKESQKG
ncbi:MAG: DUF2093 domain-containing protein [Maricaulaceae bacterium]|jgi:hypothetical protein